LGFSNGGGSKAGRKLSYKAKVMFNGNLMVGKAYTQLLGLKHGDEFTIKLGRKAIQLVPINDGDSDSSSSEEDISYEPAVETSHYHHH
jgi:hypothetical protein